MSSTPLIDAIVDRFGAAVTATHAYRGDETVQVERDRVHEVAQHLRDDPALAMNFLMDLTAVDYSAFGKGPAPAFFSSSGVALRPSSGIPDPTPWPGPPAGVRLVVVYHFYSTRHKHRLRLVAPVDDKSPEIDTVSDLWPGANWLEREVWDMFGIDFRGHPDQRRILMYAEFEGHPLRKDYPVKKRQPLIGPVN